jgi:hypothetical protein
MSILIQLVKVEISFPETVEVCLLKTIFEEIKIGASQVTSQLFSERNFFFKKISIIV